jgi:hypothetical protein
MAERDRMINGRPDDLQTYADSLRACTGSVSVTVTDKGQTVTSTPSAVYMVITVRDGQVVDVEVLDQFPRWDWLSLGQIVRVGNVNGGDSVVVDMPVENRGR